MQYPKISNVQVSVSYPIFFAIIFPSLSSLFYATNAIKFLRFGVKTHVYTLVEQRRTCTYVRVPEPACGYYSSLFAATSFNYPGQPEVDVIYAL